MDIEEKKEQKHTETKVLVTGASGLAKILFNLSIILITCYSMFLYYINAVIF